MHFQAKTQEVKPPPPLNHEQSESIDFNILQLTVLHLTKLLTQEVSWNTDFTFDTTSFTNSEFWAWLHFTKYNLGTQNHM